MSHKFNAQNKHNLFNDLRKKILPADKILKKVGLSKGMFFADIGCGNGYFTLPASEIVGHLGKVFALDISEEMLYDLQLKIQNSNNSDNINNIKIIKSLENSLPIDNDIIDMAFSSNVLHEVNNPDLFIKEIKRILKLNAKIVIIDWEKNDNNNLNVNYNYGPNINHRISIEAVQKILKQNEFKDISYFTIENIFYCITAIK